MIFAHTYLHHRNENEGNLEGDERPCSKGQPVVVGRAARPKHLLYVLGDEIERGQGHTKVLSLTDTATQDGLIVLGIQSRLLLLLPALLPMRANAPGVELFSTYIAFRHCRGILMKD